MWQFNTTVAFFLSSFGFYLYDDTGNPDSLRVETSYGRLEGLNSISRNGREFYEFLGIPYAKPPIDDLRFAPPVFPDPWNGTRDATYMGSTCMQIEPFTQARQGSEDCLYLNVFTHQIQNRKQDVPLIELHPVIFFIHGGLFMSGGTLVHQPKYFMDEDIVLVTINYRLGSFGFINIGHKEASGNMGLKDQVMALKWVQENIHYFGGDMNRVTIMGESAGAASAHYHMLSDMSKGLFHRVISQSGTALAPWALVHKPIKQAQDLAGKFNCRKKTQVETIACLRGLDAETIVGAHRDSIHILHNPLAMFGPSVESVKNSEVFLSDLPIKLMKSKPVTSVPWIIGANSEEGLIFAAPMINNETVRNQLNKNWTHWAPKLLGYEYEPKQRKDELSRRIWNFYFSGSPGGISMNSLENVTNLMSDRNFFTSLHCVANSNQDESSEDTPLYLYYYSYRSKFSLGDLMFGLTTDFPAMMDVAGTTQALWVPSKIPGPPGPNSNKTFGTCHADEIFLMFNVPHQTEHKKGTQDYRMSRMLVKLWSSFARDGEPTHVQNSRWYPVIHDRKDCISDDATVDDDATTTTAPSVRYMRLDSKAELIDEPFQERIKFWNSLNFPTLS